MEVIIIPPMVNIKEEIYVEIIRSLPEGDSDIGAFVNSTLRTALKMSVKLPPRLNGFSLSIYILIFENQFTDI